MIVAAEITGGALVEPQSFALDEVRRAERRALIEERAKEWRRAAREHERFVARLARESSVCDEVTDDDIRVGVAAAVGEPVPPSRPRIDEDDLGEQIANQIGWCPGCEDFTTTGVKPHEYGVTCTDCNDEGVVGAMHAVRNGFVEVVS